MGAATTFDEATLEVIFTPFNGAGSPPPLFSCLIIIFPSADWSPTNALTE